ncbi:MAG TPA: hypothetical protein EYP85_00070 [Armatimonadetes bacterium]|nr:hypothetical protein [Armatimonadota bacterium]
MRFCGILGLSLSLFLMEGGSGMGTSPAQPVVEFVAGERARIEVFTAERRKTPVSPYLYGKFTEHLGRNIYNGMWAQVLWNTGFEPGKYFGQRGEAAREQRLRQIERYLNLPGLVESYRQGVAYAWARYGGGEVTYSLDADRINSDTAQKIVVRALSTPEVGLQQPLFLPLHRTGDYELRLWAKGTVKTLHVAVRTLEGQELGGGTLTGLSREWQRHTLRFTLQREGVARGQVLRFTLGLQEPGTLWLDQCFLFPADHQRGFDPDVVRLLRESNLTLLRYPGGNFASGYHWKEGVGPMDERPIRLNPAWNRDEPNHVGTDEFMAFCELVGCEPLICVNAGDGTPEEAAQWVEYCNGGPDTEYGALRAKNGHPEPYGVKFWEIGNELYGHWQIGHCTAPEYAERYAQFYQAMRARDPDILFIANGQHAAWNGPIIQRDAQILHSLSIHTLIGGGVPADTPPETVFRSLMAYPTWYEGHLQALGRQMAQGGVRPRLAITELQIFTNKPNLPNNSTLSEALFWAGIVNTAIRLGDLVELITHSALVNHGGGLRKEREIVYPNPVYWARRLYATQPGRWPVRVRVTTPHFSVLRLHNLPAVRNAPYLDAVALLDDAGEELNLLVTNRHPTDALAAEIVLADLPAQTEVFVQTLTGSDYMARNTWERPGEVKLRESTIKAQAKGLTYTFPACSLTRLRFRLIKP